MPTMRLLYCKLHILALVTVTCLLREARSFLELRQNQSWPKRTYPGHLEFPTRSDVLYLGKLLDGELITPLDESYLNESLTINHRFKRLPGFIVKPKTIADIQRSVLFARKYNLHLSVRSSGHDFIGRSTHDGSLNLNLQSMNDVKVKLDSARNKAGEITIQSGAAWFDVYTQIGEVVGPDETGKKTIGRVIVGGTARLLAMGGYTQGGGHSLMSRKFGLAVDNLLEATIVTPDAKVHIVNEFTTLTRDLEGNLTESNDTSLFWAIRGGGGGTWGVVVDFTFKIHYAPERFRSIILVMPSLDMSGNPVNRDVMDMVYQEVHQLSSDWGGYVIATPGSIYGIQCKAYMLLYLNHMGSNCSASNQEIETLLRNPGWTIKEDKSRQSFVDDLQTTIPVNEAYTSYHFSSMIQGTTTKNATTRAEFVDMIYDMLKAGVYCNGTLIGGKMANVTTDSTPIHPAFRSGLLSMTCGANWPVEFDNMVVDKALNLAPNLYKFGLGSYINEPAEDMPDWKTRFWGHEQTYERLLNIKKKVDPNNYLWCHNCVGSDLGNNYADPSSEGIPGRPVHSNFKSGVEFDQIKS